MDIAIVANAIRTSDTQLHHRVRSGDVEIGAGWNSRSRQCIPQPCGPRVRTASPLRPSESPPGAEDERFAIIWNPTD